MATIIRNVAEKDGDVEGKDGECSSERMGDVTEKDGECDREGWGM